MRLAATTTSPKPHLRQRQSSLERRLPSRRDALGGEPLRHRLPGGPQPPGEFHRVLGRNRALSLPGLHQALPGLEALQGVA